MSMDGKPCEYETLNSGTLLAKIETRMNFRLVNIQSISETDLERNLLKVGRDEEIILCGSADPGPAARKLSSLGFKKIRVYEGGLSRLFPRKRPDGNAH